MNILGVGPGEVLVVLILMLIVAGPKRMIQWAYYVGRYTAKMRTMFQETMNVIQKELAESGVEVPKELAELQKSGFDIVREASKVINAEPSSAAPSPSTPPPASSVEPKPAAAPPAEPDPSATPGPTPGNDSNSQSDSDKPRYDAWTLN